MLRIAMARSLGLIGVQRETDLLLLHVAAGPKFDRR